MEDPVLNRSLDETRELQARWAQFRDFYMMAAKGQQKVTAQAEMKFLELKSRIAMLHDGFMEKLQHDQKTGQNIITIIGDCILLGRVPNASEAEKQKFEFDWNECYMLITEQVGALEEEKQRLAGINEKVYRAQKRKEEMTAAFHNFLHSAGLKWSIIAIVIFFVVYGIPAFGIYDYRQLGEISFLKPVYNIFVNNVYRPFINHDIEFPARADIPTINPELPAGKIQAVTDQPLTKEFFLNSELASMGVTADSRKKIEELLGKPGALLEFERFTAEGQDTRFYWMFFKNTEDAKAMVGVFQDALKALKDDKRKLMTDITYLQRSANLVMLGRGSHGHRAGYPINKFRLKPDTPSLLVP